MQESYKKIAEYIMRFFQNDMALAILFLIAVIVIFLLSRHKRKLLIYPMLILMFMIFNPVLYKMYNKLLGDTYWRLFWLIPIVPTLSYAIVLCLKKNDNLIIKSMITLIYMVVIIIGGICMYGNNVYRGNNFEAVANAYKLPQESIEVADKLLELEKSPHAVVSFDLYCYLRQYNTNIKQFYGRNAEGYIQTTTGVYDTVKWINMQEVPSAKIVNERTAPYNYNYWILSKDSKVDVEELNKYYILAGQTESYNIYRSIAYESE